MFSRTKAEADNKAATAHTAGQMNVCQRIVQCIQQASKSSRGLRQTWPLLARDVIALLAGLRQAVMLDYAAKLDPAALQAMIRDVQRCVLPAGALRWAECIRVRTYQRAAIARSLVCCQPLHIMPVYSIQRCSLTHLDICEACAHDASFLLLQSVIPICRPNAGCCMPGRLLLPAASGHAG